MKHFRLGALALFTVLMGIVLLMPLSASAAPAHTSSANTSSAAKSGFTNIPVHGTTSNGGSFKGVLNVTSFAAQGSSLVANGTLSGTLRNAAGQVIGTVTNQAVTLPTAITQATCQVLKLTLGPLDLNLLGLMVHLDRVVLTITANPAGGLLGQLLCDIANLLNGGGALSQIVADLNQILSLLGG